MDGEKIKVIVKKYWPIAVGAVVVIYLYKKNASNNASAGTQTVYVPTSSGTDNTQALQDQLQAAQIGLAQQQEQDAVANAQQQNTIQYTAALGATAGQVGSAIAQIYQAEGQLPAAAINAASQQNQVALAAAANVAASGVQALPGYLNAAANTTVAAYAPLAAYANGIGGMVQSTAQNSSQVLNAVSQSGNSSAQSAANAAGAGASANAQSSASTMQTVGEVASVAALLLL